jgi:hypothetical protein
MLNEYYLLEKIETYFNQLQLEPLANLDKTKQEALNIFSASIEKQMEYISNLEGSVKEHGIKYFIELLLKEEIELKNASKDTVNPKLLLLYYLYHTDFNFDYLQ